MNRTIAALATPPGTSGLAVIRLSGVESIEIIKKCFVSKNTIDFNLGSRIYYGKLLYKSELIDTVTISVFRSPNSYTGDDTIEISCHGNSILANRIIDILVELGANYAEPGEYTKRAFLNGKLDLSQVEAVADLIHSVSNAGVETAAKQLEGNFSRRLKILRQELLDSSSLLELELDFADEGLDLINKDKIKDEINESIKFCNNLIDSYTASEICRSGYYVSIAGYPNSGKSTLFNAILERNRAIVSHIAGTTRDYLEESIYHNGMKIIIADTAGLRDTDDFIEIEGIKLVESVIEKSNLVIVLNDSYIDINASNTLADRIKSKYPTKEVLIIQNKVDINNFKLSEQFCISAKTGYGIVELKNEISQRATQSIGHLSDILINSRHRQLLIKAKSHLEIALESLNLNMENEVIAVDMKLATRILGELTGESWNEEVLANIFSRFCIGK